MGIFATTDSKQETSLVLKAVMDLTVAEDLRMGFLDCLSRNKPIKILAGDVERITTPCLQVLLAMKNKASEQDIDFLIPQMSEAFHKALRDVGLEDQLLNSEQKA
jgi:anti-anti-sigma regulatory factor